MIARCHAPSASDYRLRGVAVCDRWRASFEAFLADMGECPGKDMTLDRKDNSRGYSPDNCRWATKIQQARNKTTNRLITHNGETRCLSEWAESIGIPPLRIAERLKRGWTLDRALSP